MGEAVATVSHSIKNMLQGLRSGADAVELALARHDLEMAQKGWPIVARNLDRVMQVTLNMLAFAKDRPLDPEPTLLDGMVDEACALAEAALRRRSGALERTRAEGLVEIPIDLVAVHQTPRVAVSTHWIAPCPRWPSGAVATVVRDDGPGVPDSMRDRLFQPFATSKGQRGTGLGLVVARKLALLHGGAVEHAGNGDAWPAHPVLGGQVRAADAGRALPGAAFVLVLPAAASQDADETRAPKPIPGGDLGVRFGA
jgi:signal transduction histidine kinase